MVPLLTEMVGSGETVTVPTTVLLAGHPALLLPVTEYEVVLPGDTVKLPPVIEYEFAPVGTKTNDEPLQMLPLLTAIVGVVFTEILLTAARVLTQPAVLVPVTE